MNNKFIFLTSWDDGFPSDLRVAELLSKYELQGTFFVPIKNKEGHPVMTAGEVAELSRRFEIGGHTFNHVYLTRQLTRETMRKEVLSGKNSLEDWIGQTISGFCYPGGVYNEIAIEEVKKAGFTYGRTTENLRTDAGRDKWLIPTTLQFFPHRKNIYLRNFLRYPSWRKLAICAHRISAETAIDFLARLLNSKDNNQFIFHLWGHSWELDKYSLWKELECFLREVSRLDPLSLQLRDLKITKPQISLA